MPYELELIVNFLGYLLHWHFDSDLVVIKKGIFTKSSVVLSCGRQQRRREAEEKKSSGRKLERRSWAIHCTTYQWIIIQHFVVDKSISFFLTWTPCNGLVSFLNIGPFIWQKWLFFLFLIFYFSFSSALAPIYMTWSLGFWTWSQRWRACTVHSKSRYLFIIVP